MKILVWIFGLLACAFVIAHAPFSTDMSAFLPRAPSPAQQILADQLHDGVVARLILVGIEGAPADTLVALNKEMAKTLRQDPHFNAINNGETYYQKGDRDFLWHNRYLLNPDVTAERFSADGLHKALENDVRLLGSSLSPLVKQSLPEDPTGEVLGLAKALGGGTHPAQRNGVWVSADGSRALLLAQTQAPGFDIDAQEEDLRLLQTAFDNAKRVIGNADTAKLLATGPGVFAVEGRAHMKADAARFSTIATLLVAALLLLTYRSPRVLVLALLPVASGVAVGMAAVALHFGFIHGITVGFGVTLIGEAVDYAIYLFTQTSPGSPAKETLPRIWPTLRLGVLTSVFGFGAMLFSNFTGFAQLGLFTIAGLVTAVCVTRFILPQLLGPHFATVHPETFARALTALSTHARLMGATVATLIVASILVLCLHKGDLWESKLASLSPLTPAQQKLDQQLRHDIGAPDPRYLIMIKQAGDERALTVAEQIIPGLETLIAEGHLAGFDSPSEYLPSHAAQSLRRAALPDEPTLRANLAAALHGLPFQPALFEPFLAAIAAEPARALLDRKNLEGTSLALKVDSELLHKPDGTVALMTLRGVIDPAPIAALAQQKDSVLLDIKSESDQLLTSYRHEAMTLSLIGTLSIIVLLLVSLRSFKRVALIMAPLAASVLVTAAIMVLIVDKLSIFNLFGLLLTVAVGSNYCLFFERHRVENQHRERTLASLVLANLCTVIGFGILSFSHIPVLHGIGGTVAIGAFLSLIFGAILIRSNKHA